MRSNLRRVNIVLTKQQHEQFKDFAQRYHGSVSQFLRLAAQMEIENENGKEGVNLRPFLESLDKTNVEIRQIDARLERINKAVEHVLETQGKWLQKVSSDIESLLYQQRRGLSITEMKNYLPYTQNDLIRGIEKLEDEFAVTRSEQVNSPSKWMIRGDKHDN